MAYLVCIKGPDKGKIVELKGDITDIGRTGDDGLKLGYDQSSRRHC